MKLITTATIMSHDPCEDYPESRVQELIGTGKTPLEILDLKIPVPDRIWVLTRPGIVSGTMQEKFGRKCALSVADIWDAPDIVQNYLKTGDEPLRNKALVIIENALLGTCEARAPALAAARAAARAALVAGAARATQVALVALVTGAARATQVAREEQIGFFREILSKGDVQ